MRIRNRSSATRRAVRAAIAAGVVGLVSLGMVSPATAADAPDVAIAKVSSASGALAAGDDLTYTITVANAGPAVAMGVHLNDQLPEGAQFVSASPSLGACSPSSADVVCELGDLASGATATVTVVVKSANAGTAVNTAYVTSRMLDPNTGDNQASATTEVQPASGGGSEPSPVVPLPPRPPSSDQLF